MRASKLAKKADTVSRAFDPDGIAGRRMEPLRQLVELAPTIVTSSAESERQFSTLARVKTRLRNRLLNPTRIEDTDENEMDDATAEEVIDLFTTGLSTGTLRESWFSGARAAEASVAKKRKIDLTLP